MHSEFTDLIVHNYTLRAGKKYTCKTDGSRNDSAENHIFL